MGQKSGRGSPPRIPPCIDNIDVNRCANPRCSNFGVSAANSRNEPNYSLTGSGKHSSSLRCRACGRHYLLKSNQAVADEVRRLAARQQLAVVYRQDGLCCHNLNCEHFGHIDTVPGPRYRSRGYTSQGNPRIQCKACGTTFTRGSQKRKSHPKGRTHDNVWLFRQLVNQTGINRAMELTDLGASTVYHKIDMFYQRCLFFLQQREARLQEMELHWMRLSTDRQEYGVNWTTREDKRNVVISAIGTADRASRYVFGMEVNFDPDIELATVMASPEYTADAFQKEYHRHYARIYTPRDHSDALRANAAYERRKQAALEHYLAHYGSHIGEAGLMYLQGEIEQQLGVSPGDFSQTVKLPSSGVQVRPEYTQYAHFLRLRSLIGHCRGLRFYLDQEAGINRACSLAFAEPIQAGRCHLAYVKIDKDLSVDERRMRVRLTHKLVDSLGGDAHSAHRRIVEQQLSRPPIRFKGSPDEWYAVPIHKIYEADKYVSILTDRQRLGDEATVSLLLDASLHPIDNFFQIVRRRISFLERPMTSQSNSGRVWTGRSPYNPAMINKLLFLLRTYYNYCHPGDDGLTPAQRLGLARGRVEIRKILYPG